MIVFHFEQILKAINWAEKKRAMSCLILVGKEPRLEKSASCAPWEKSSNRWVRLGHLWDDVRARG